MYSNEFLYKILDASPPAPLPDTLPSTELDTKDNFIHLSTASQTPITANLFFSHCDTLWVLKLRSSDLDGRLDYPEELGGGCAHVHESVKGLGRGNVVKVIELTKGKGEYWKQSSIVATLEA